MRLAIATATALAAAAAVALAAAPAPACACGVALRADVARERALVIERPGREEIIASFDLRSDGTGRAAIVLPVPGTPQVEAIEQGDPLAYLDQATAPPPTAAGDAAGGAQADDTARAPVDVIGREVVGGYDVTRLRAGDPRALDEWLQTNGYTLPDGARPILSDYIDEDWKFVAIRLAEEEDGRLKPLRVSFPAERLVYPMRLTQLGEHPVSLTLYVLADDERTADGLESSYDGPVSRLEPEPPAELASLFEGGSYLTKLEAESVPASRFTQDIAIRPGEALTTFGSGTAQAGDDDNDATTYLLVALAVAVVGLGAFALVRRRGA